MKKKGKKRKIRIKKTRLFTVLGTIAIGLILIFVDFGESKDKQTASMKVVSDYMSLASEEKYDDMYQLLDSTSQKKITKEDFVKRNKEIYESLEATGMTVSNMTEEELENRKNQSNVHK